jgi:Mechanosensitive ion channel
MKENMTPIPRLTLARRLLLIAVALLATAATASAMTTPGVAGLSSEAILDHLNAVIDWYRNNQTNVPNVGLPSDAMYEFNARSTAAEVAQLAFEAASADAALIPAASAANTGQTTAQLGLVKTDNDVAARIRVLQAQISSLNQQIAGARKAELQELTEERDRAQGELDLRNAMHDALGQMVKFNANGESGQSGLQGSINELRSSVPELAPSVAAKTTGKTPSPGTNTTAAANGLIGEVVALYDQLQALNQVSRLMTQTASVRDAAMKLRNPLLTTLKATIQQGEQMAASPNSAPAEAATAPAPAPVTIGAKNNSKPDPERQQFDVLATRFKQISAAALPLSQEILLLDQANSNFLEWRQALIHESNRILRTVVLRVMAIALAIGIILLLSEIWRRITFRYITDVRRRRQFLMLRRIVIGFCMGIVFILGFVSEFSSLATFAGFITAGLAVGLQTILLSVAAYFFLVGRWGIRVGDRITVAGVTGDVVDVGLVRLYLTELAGTGVDLHPTGRIVVLSNAVLFQATTPLFKQLPGAEYTWHEVAVALNNGGNHGLVEQQLLGAVHSMHSPYGEELQRQLGQTERRIDIQMKVPKPHGLLQYTDTGLEYVVRYPVALHQVSEVDEKITRRLLDLLQQQPELQASLTGFPKIRAAVKG